MSLLFLALSLTGAWLTYNMFRPTYVGVRRATVSFFAGWLWGELALHAIVVQVVGAVILISAGALGAWPGELALVVTIVSCIALARGFWGGTHAVPAIERALKDALGDDYEEKILPELRSGHEHGIRWRSILRPFPIRHPEVERIADIPFARERGITLKLDVYRHRSMPKDCPTLLQIHGGAWVIGDKKEQGLPLMNHLAGKGWVCVSANYRLSPHATFPEHLIDVKRALGWIREHARDYGADPDFVVVTGGSAGGHLAALLALTAGDPEYQPGFETTDTAVQGCVPIYGVYDFTDRQGIRFHAGRSRLLERRVLKGSPEEIPDEYRKASPVERIGRDAPPFFIVHGDLDTLSPVDDARRFAERLREISASSVAYAEIPGAQHAFELFPSLRTQAVVDGVERFVTYLYSQYSRGRVSAGEPAAAETPKPARPTKKVAAASKRGSAKKKATTKAVPKKASKKPAAKKAPPRKNTGKKTSTRASTPRRRSRARFGS